MFVKINLINCTFFKKLIIFNTSIVFTVIQNFLLFIYLYVNKQGQDFYATACFLFCYVQMKFQGVMFTICTILMKMILFLFCIFLRTLSSMHVFAYSGTSVFFVLKPVKIKLINANNLVFWSKINCICILYPQSVSYTAIRGKRVNSLTEKDKYNC